MEMITLNMTLEQALELAINNLEVRIQLRELGFADKLDSFLSVKPKTSKFIPKWEHLV